MSDLSFDELARANGLRLVGQRPPFIQYLKDAWRWRAFAVTLARYRIQSDNGQNKLGMVWVVLRPLLNAAVYGLVFGLLIDKGRPDNFIPYVLCGVFVFQFFASALQKGSRSITGNIKLVQSISFPRILLPISTILEEAFRFLALLAVLGILLMIFQEWPNWQWLLVPPIMLMYLLFNAGIAMIVARLSVHLRDLQQMIPFISRLLFYTSSIFFSVDLAFKDNPTVLAVVHSIPTYEFVALARDMLIAGDPVSAQVWILAPIWATVAFVFGVIFFWQAEVRYGRDS